MEKDHQDGLIGPALARGRHVSWFRMFLNILGCFMCIPIYWVITVHCRFPVTLDLFMTITLTELNRFVNEGRRIRFYEQESPDPLLPPRDEKVDNEKMNFLESQPMPQSRLDCMAAVVGWREDPELFTRALESYKAASKCVFMLVGIDGDDEEYDQDMVNVFNEVFPSQSRTIHVPQPLGEVAEQVMSKLVAMRKENGQNVDRVECEEIALRHCIQLAKTILEQEGINLTDMRQLCIRQRHMHKKGIMFTTYIFALVIADILGIEFLWSSDSDTLVLPDSIHRTVDAIAADSSIGGASSGLIVHNAHETAVTNLAATVYWGELYLTRSTPAATATSDCQSGPSTLFRLSALPAILIPWYLQTLMGKRMIINEDRHLTTNLLARGWGVVFASDVLTVTDTPTTLARWLKQQIRWARATHIESLLQPRVYLMSHPLLFYGMARREFGPLTAAIAIFYYFLTGEQLIIVFVTDLLIRILMSSLYNILRNPHRLNRQSLKWVVPGIFFYHVPLPAVHVWSLFTLTADGWGTSMRSSSAMARKDSARQAWWETGFFVVWAGVVAGSAARWLATLYEVEWVHLMGAMVLSSLMASYWAWRVTIHTIS
ncbi:Hyaluronan synthase 1-like protein [Cladobotryum mycophilum]|uniref:Hyaluronan synthase 1-like protein n=1 Tax=Cladobotryum mycophilum TaxID=491253 RepID=A0ABR0S9U3_9HYPO